MVINDYEMGPHPWNFSKRCPEASIPIERAQRNGHLRDNPLVQLLLGDYSKDGSQHEHSIIYVTGDKYFGAKASINVWNPKVDKYEFSVSQIWVISEDERTSLEAGWMVGPLLYGDSETRFFTYWTADHYKTGCYNHACPGFVQTNQHSTLGTYLKPVSVYDGQQYSIDVEIFKDRETGNWWLLLQGVEMGYWPKELVPSLAGGAGVIEFGGEILNLRPWGVHTSTQMGSSHFSHEGFRKSSFFKNIQFLDTSYAFRAPAHTDSVIESPTCYDLQVGSKKNGPWGYFFFYGGPGRSANCT